MANLSFIDKQLIEDVLGMGGGYVLDFQIEHSMSL